MARNTHAQIKSLVENARHILIAFSTPDGDSIASATALALFLDKLGPRVDIACPHFALPKKYQFLKRAQDIAPTLPHIQKFMISIDIADAGVEELSYDVKDQQLNIFITPEQGSLTSNHVHTAQSEFRYDLILTVNTTDVHGLGDLYTTNADLFHKIPLITFDHRASNEQYGHVNAVDVTAGATTEVLFEAFKSINSSFIDDDVATALLTGMIANTQSFKAEHINPHTLASASELISMGADREYVIRHLYQTKTLSMLRLWGEALSHLEFDKELGLVSTTITREDFARSGATEHELYDIIDELIINSPEERLTLLLHEHPHATHGDTIHGILSVEKEFDATRLVAPLNPTGDKHQVSFQIEGKSLKQAHAFVIDMIRERLK